MASWLLAASAVKSAAAISRIILTTYLVIELLPCNWAAEAINFEESKQFMNDKVLRVLIFQYPPLCIVNELSNGTVILRGIASEMLSYFANNLNISYEYVLLKPEAVKAFGGSGPAQVNAIKNDEADLAACGIISSHSKYQQVDFSMTWLFQSLEIVVPWPKQDEDGHLIATPIRPFQPMVWLCLGFSLVAMTLTLTCLSGVYRKYFVTEIGQNESSGSIPLIDFGSLGRNCIFVWSHLTNHFYYIRLNSRRSVLILVGVWCLMTVVLSNAYAGTLLSFLSVKKMGPVLNSLDELANSKEIQLVIQAGSDLANKFLDFNATGTDKMLDDSLREHHDNLIYKLNLDILKEKMMNGSYATIHVDVVTHSIIDSTYRQNGRKCQFTLAKKKVESFINVATILRKNSPYTDAINQQILKLFDSGLMDVFVQKYVPRIDQCLIQNQKPDSNYRNLSLWNMSFAFFVFGPGFGLAAIAFAVEKLYFIWIQYRNQRNPNAENPKTRIKKIKPMALELSKQKVEDSLVKNQHNLNEKKKETKLTKNIKPTSAPVGNNISLESGKKPPTGVEIYEDTISTKNKELKASEIVVAADDGLKLTESSLNRQTEQMVQPKKETIEEIIVDILQV